MNLLHLVCKSINSQAKTSKVNTIVCTSRVISRILAQAELLTTTWCLKRKKIIKLHYSICIFTRTSLSLLSKEVTCRSTWALASNLHNFCCLSFPRLVWGLYFPLQFSHTELYSTVNKISPTLPTWPDLFFYNLFINITFPRKMKRD